MNNNFKLIDIVIRLCVLAFIIFCCVILLRPFVGVTMWAIILAIAFYPIFLWLKNILGGRSKLAATLITLVCIGIIIGPVGFMAKVLVVNLQNLAARITDGTLTVPPPPEEIKNFPVIGEPLNNLWQLAYGNIEEFLKTLDPQIKALGSKLVEIVANVGIAMVQFIISIIIAAPLMLNATKINRNLIRFITKLTPTQGEAFITLASSTLRNVIRGVIGISAVQSLLIGIGFILAGIPAAGLLAFLCLILTIVQIGPGLVALPTLIFAWSKLGTVTALLLTIWTIPVTLMDNFLKPIIMARGLPVPMIVIFMGVLGGTITQGIIGLFVGPVILALGYELMQAWINDDIIEEVISEEVISEEVISEEVINEEK